MKGGDLMRMSRILGMMALAVMMCLPTFAISSSDRTVYEQPTVQPGKIIKGKVMNVVKLKGNAAQPVWHVFVEDQETGDLVLLHVDKRTTRKDFMVSPDIGDNVIAKYNGRDNHAYSFLTDARDHN